MIKFLFIVCLVPCLVVPFAGQTSCFAPYDIGLKCVQSVGLHTAGGRADPYDTPAVTSAVPTAGVSLQPVVISQ